MVSFVYLRLFTDESGGVYENDVLDLLAEVNRLVPLVVEAHKNVAVLGDL